MFNILVHCADISSFTNIEITQTLINKNIILLQYLNSILKNNKIRFYCLILETWIFSRMYYVFFFLLLLFLVIDNGRWGKKKPLISNSIY